MAFSSGTGFLVFAIVAGLSLIWLWRAGIGLGTRVLLVGGFILGASFVYNLWEALQASR